MTSDAKGLAGIAAAAALWGLMQRMPGFQVQGAAFVLAGVLCAFVAEAFEDALPVWLCELVTFFVYPALVGVGIGLATAR